MGALLGCAVGRAGLIPLVRWEGGGFCVALLVFICLRESGSFVFFPKGGWSCDVVQFCNVGDHIFVVLSMYSMGLSCGILVVYLYSNVCSWYGYLLWIYVLLPGAFVSSAADDGRGTGSPASASSASPSSSSSPSTTSSVGAGSARVLRIAGSKNFFGRGSLPSFN